MRKILFIGIFALMSFTFSEPDKIKLYLIGDSTIAQKEMKAFPETGWNKQRWRR